MNDENSAEQMDSCKAPKGKKEQSDNKAASEPDEVEKLQESFGRVYNGPNKLRHEYDLRFEAKQLNIEIEEYLRWYELSSKPPIWLSRIWHWTGFGEKKLWDVLQLLIIPGVLIWGANYLQDTAKRTEQAQSENLNRQESLNKYFDTMTTFLFERNLRTSKEDAEVRTIARAKTLTTLGNLNDERKGQLLRFLQEAQLIRDGGVIVSLRRANLIGAEILIANLSKADLTRAILSEAKLELADFSNANLTRTNLFKANLEGAKFRDAHLKNALLTQAILKKADFTGADLEGANFVGANLSGAKPFSEKQLGQAKFCHTTMPDGKPNDQNCPELSKTDLYDRYDLYL